MKPTLVLPIAQQEIQRSKAAGKVVYKVYLETKWRVRKAREADTQSLLTMQ
jgi:hypothetical protein